MNANHQQILFEEIQQKLGKGKSLAESLSEILSVSVDSAYRRISGKTSLTFEEAVILANEYGISFDALFNHDRGTIAFERRSTLKTENDIAIHLKEMTEMMKLQIEHKGGKSIYTTKDIPVFYHFYFPELGAFKVFCWHRALNSSSELNESFVPEKYMESYGNLFKDIEELYSKVPSVEIWSEIAVLGFLRQLQYYFDSGLMGNKDTALLLIDQHKQVFDLVKEQARLGKKVYKNQVRETTDYELYFNELFVMDNAALARLKQGKVYFSSYAYFNYIPTFDQKFSADVESWLENQMLRSVNLSSGREKERNMFFKNIQQELDRTENYIKSN